MNGFVAKPATLDRLSAAIAAVLSRAAAASAAVRAPMPARHEGAEPGGCATLRGLSDILGAAAVIEIVTVFLDDLPGRLARLATHARSGNAGALGQEAHALAGGAATVGLARLAERAGEVERLLRDGSAAVPAEILHALDRCSRDGAATLTAWLVEAAAGLPSPEIAVNAA
jgi:HPt (histidine-containing phosphotransfer) domain-containing protein